MLDLSTLTQTVTDRAETLFETRADKIDWADLSHYPLRDIVKGSYVDGVRDAMRYLESLLAESAEA